jgi:short-subunit dehydrogenase
MEHEAMPQVRNALVTGASSGIGRELVRQLVRDRGMTVLASARRRDRLESLAAELPPGRVQIAVGDLAESTFRQALWEQAEAMPGGLDLLVNNAGLGNYSELETQGPEAIRQIIEVNLVALIDLTQKAIRSMRIRGTGQVLQISSVLGFIGLRDSAVYVASKHAVNGLVKSLAYELRGTGVRVWAACPGRTESEFRQVALGDHALTATSSAHAEPVAKVVRAIVRGIDGRSTFLMPSWPSWAIVTLAHWLPGPFDFAMTRWTPSSYKDALTGVQAAPGPESNRTK